MKSFFSSVGRGGLTALVLMGLVNSVAAGDKTKSIRFVADPPPAADGRLTRLNVIQPWDGWNSREKLVYGHDAWKGEKDSSGEVLLAWDLIHLYIGVKVKDDSFVQPFKGVNLYQGDHVMLFLDAPRQAEGARDANRLLRIGLNPGNFAEGEAIPPELYVYRGNWRTGLTGENSRLPNSRIQAIRRTDGYQIEAAIAWRDLGIDRVEEGMLIGYDVVLSDTDDPRQPRQEKMASLLTGAWGDPNPERLIEGVLAQTSGEVSPEKRRNSGLVRVVNEESIASGGKWRAVVEGRPLVKELVVKARIDHKLVAGGTGAMEVFVNGRKLGVGESQNRLAQFNLGVVEQSTYGFDGWFVYYTPSFAPIGANSIYFTSDFDPYLFRFNVSELWKPEGNVVEIRHTGKAKEPLAIEVFTSDQLSAKVQEVAMEAAPTGEIPTYAPSSIPEKDLYQAQLLEGGAIRITQPGKGDWVVESAFSNRSPGWNRLLSSGAEGGWSSLSVKAAGLTAGTGEMSVQRELKKLDDRIIVIDKLTNLTGDDLPVILRHQWKANTDNIYLSGRRVAHPVYRLQDSEAPTSLALREGYGLGAVAEGDIFRAQVTNFVENGWMGLENSHLVVKKGASVSLEFSIYPLEKDSPFLLVNRIRNSWGTNFTLPGGFGVIGMNPTTDRMSDEEMAERIKAANARYVIVGNPYYTGRSDTPDGIAAFSNRLFELDSTIVKNFIKRIKTVAPESKVLYYNHVFISNGTKDEELFAENRLIMPDGSPASYRQKEYPLFIPYGGNAFSNLQGKILEHTFEIGFDGVFWDETEYSAYKYDYSTNRWDGVSGDIDPDTHQLRRKISNVALLTQPWRITYAEKILSRGMLVGNGSPHTKGMTDLHFPRFTETGAIVNLVKAQLYTPIALGDAMTERNGIEVYRNVLRALNYGCLTYWYSLHNTRHSYPDSPISHMYPFTPIELGEGYLIGQERIITNRSGLFGWNDSSDFSAIVYDHKGKRLDDYEIPRREANGKSYGEVRIPGGHIAILIRKSANQ